MYINSVFLTHTMANTRSRSKKKHRVRSPYVVHEAGDGRTNINYMDRAQMYAQAHSKYIRTVVGNFHVWHIYLYPAMAAKQLKPSIPDFETGI